MTETTIKLRSYNDDTHRYEETGESLSAYQLARSLTPGNLAALLQDYLNLGGKGFREGREIGLLLRTTHRSLQRLAICFVFGLVAGLSEQEFTDPRNATAIQTAQKLVELLKSGELPFGPYI